MLGSFLFWSLQAWAGGSRLAEVGEQLGGAQVAAVEEHAEYQRYVLQWPDGGQAIAEITDWDAEHVGLCIAGPLTLFPRSDLLQGPESARAGDGYDALCERLKQRPQALPLAQDSVASSSFPIPSLGIVLSRAFLLPLTLGILAATGLVALLRSWRLLPEALLWMGMAILFRLILIEPGIFNGAEAGYEKLEHALDWVQHSPYGDGQPVLFRPLLKLLNPSPEGIFSGTMLLSVGTVGLVWGWLRMEVGAVGARAGALMWCLLPVPLLLSRSEDPSVGVVFFGALALLAATVWRRDGGLLPAVLAALSAGFLVHIRPEAGLLVGAAAAMAFRPPKGGYDWMTVGIAAAIVGMLLWLRLPLGVGQQQVLEPSNLLRPSSAFWLWAPVITPRYAVVQLVMLITKMPPILPILGLVGLLAAEGRWRRVVIWAVLTLPVAVKTNVYADIFRLQHPTLLVWVLSAAVAAELIAARIGQRWMLLFLFLGILPWTATAAPGWVHQREYQWLATVVPQIPEHQRIFYFDPHSRAKSMRAVMERLGPGRWSGGGEPQAGDWIYRGVGCYLPEGQRCRDWLARCDVEEAEGLRLPPRTDLDLDLQLDPREETVFLGFYRVKDCTARAKP